MRPAIPSLRYAECIRFVGGALRRWCILALRSPNPNSVERPGWAGARALRSWRWQYRKAKAGLEESGDLGWRNYRSACCRAETWDFHHIRWRNWESLILTLL